MPDDVVIDALWSNPPIRMGKPALHDLLSHWLGRLADGGEACLVVHKHLGADSLTALAEPSRAGPPPGSGPGAATGSSTSPGRAGLTACAT